MALDALDGQNRRWHFWITALAMPGLGACGFMLAFGGRLPDFSQMTALAVPAYLMGTFPALLVAALHGELSRRGILGLRAIASCALLAGTFPAIVLASLYAVDLVRGAWPLAVLPVAAGSAALSILLADFLVRAMKPGLNALE